MNRAKTIQEDNMYEPGKSKGMYDPDEGLRE